MRAVVIGAISSALVGCAGASWLEVDVGQSYKAPAALRVAVVGSAREREVVQVLEEALVEELEGDGIHVQLVDESSGRADASVSIERYEPGSRVKRYFVGFGTGEGEIIVSLTSPGIDGKARGWVTGGFFGGSSSKSAIEAGHLIGKAIATGVAKADQDEHKVD